MQILNNKSVNMRSDMGYRITSLSKVKDVNKEYVEGILAISDELSKDNKSIANIEDFSRAKTRFNEKKLMRIKKIEDTQMFQKRAGFALIGSVTVIGALVMGLIIFMAIKIIVIG